MAFLRKRSYKKDLVNNLEREAWRGDIDAAYLSASADELEKILDPIRKEAGVLENRAKLFTHGQERKKVQEELEAKKKSAEVVASNISVLKKQANERRAQSAQTRDFLKFVEKNF